MKQYFQLILFLTFSIIVASFLVSIDDINVVTKEIPINNILIENNLEIQEIYKTDINKLKFYGHGEDDKHLFNKIWKNRKILRDGRFIELGAIDGLKNSNSLFFEKNLKWRGLLIEPNPIVYENLRSNRPLSTAINCAICEKSKMINYTVNLKENAVSGIKKNMPDSFIKDWYTNTKERIYKIHCEPIRNIMEITGMKYVDLFSIDVEGSERGVVYSIDFNVPIDVIIIEMDGRNKKKDEELKLFIKSKGFDMPFKIGSNGVFINKSYKVRDL